MNPWFCCQLSFWFNVSPIVFLPSNFIHICVTDAVHCLTHSRYSKNVCCSALTIICTSKMNHSLFPRHTRNFPLQCFPLCHLLFLEYFISVHQILIEPSEHSLNINYAINLFLIFTTRSDFILPKAITVTHNGSLTYLFGKYLPTKVINNQI